MSDKTFENKLIKNSKSIAPKPIGRDAESFKDVEYYPLITSREDDAPNFSMRLFKIGPNGYTTRHKHSYEHEIYVLEGEGFVYMGDSKIKIKKDDCFIIHPYEKHQLLATKSGMNVLCLVPNRLKNQPS